MLTLADTPSANWFHSEIEYPRSVIVRRGETSVRWIPLETSLATPSLSSVSGDRSAFFSESAFWPHLAKAGDDA